MSDYIKREEAEKIFVEYNCVKHHVTEMGDTNEANKIILMFRENAKKLFSLAHSEDVTPVVRCKDCKYWDEHSQYGFDSENGVYGNYCMLWTPEDDFYAVETPEDGFCYNGERKANE